MASGSVQVNLSNEDALNLMVKLLTAEGLLDTIFDAGDYVASEIHDVWQLFFGIAFTGDDLEPVPLYAEAERRAEDAVEAYILRYRPDYIPILRDRQVRRGMRLEWTDFLRDHPELIDEDGDDG